MPRTRRDPFQLLLVTGSLQGGGAERQLAGMANYWSAKGFSVTLATWSGPGIADFYALHDSVRRIHLDVNVPRSGVFPRLRSNLRRVSKLRDLLVAIRPDAVLSFVTESNVLTILAGIGLKRRIVVSERIQPALHTALPLPWRVLRRAVYSWADEVVAQTRDAARWIERHCRRKSTVIANALHFQSQVVLDRQPLIVAVGRLARQKGFDLLLEAFAPLAADFPDWNAVIIGEGHEHANLLRLRDELGLNDRVQFIGQTQDVGAWMARAGLVVQPSRFEGFPNVVMESMGLGAVVISADCPSGPSELIEHGVNGCLVPVDDVKALMQMMAKLMSQPQVRERLGLEATKVRQRFHRDSIMAQWEACLLPRLEKSQRECGLDE